MCGCVPQESDYFTPQGEFRVDKAGSPTLLNCLMYKMSYYRFGEMQVSTLLTDISPAGDQSWGKDALNRPKLNPWLLIGNKCMQVMLHIVIRSHNH